MARVPKCSELPRNDPCFGGSLNWHGEMDFTPPQALRTIDACPWGTATRCLIINYSPYLILFNWYKIIFCYIYYFFGISIKYLCTILQANNQNSCCSLKNFQPLIHLSMVQPRTLKIQVNSSQHQRLKIPKKKWVIFKILGLYGPKKMTGLI
jgi:hypothetical protein